ncbi:4Fe-4S dicluster domain-containing protein [Calidifontibacter sp. DB0510]|uniref:4Fe-4S dicluster domain-containing protein n=1 Tax=Metallococcus carri TaxID=1656884 RepID=A0A967B2M0_9MICO|nr:4Fe-4S dicluster domain-containing protein [Metallococcus carri]NHN56140.1 4Fe-4S dicluster domain-containing protein [Metallococcus carri]NOP38810.1 4Fe-4S dicluster domain-containing protein [Calidifontibacter sp. DB2511S]
MGHQLSGPTDPTRDAAWPSPEPRVGFFTDTSICIGCKACEVACKEWNAIPEDGLDFLGSSYDNSGQLGASTWRHVAFVEQSADRIEQARESGRKLVDLGMPSVGAPATAAPSGSAASSAPAADGGPAAEGAAEIPDFRWLMASDVCKHCTHAGCLDVCPTGALFRTEHGTVVVQADVCNGCGYCVGACPFGVIERRKGDSTVHNSGVAQKCTLCYDRISHDQTPACAQACPTTSIKFGPHDEMVELAEARVRELHGQGMTEARVYGANELDGVGGTGSVFLLLDEPEVYGLPPDPVVPTASIESNYKHAATAAAGLLAAAAFAFLGGAR